MNQQQRISLVMCKQVSSQYTCVTMPCTSSQQTLLFFVPFPFIFLGEGLSNLCAYGSLNVSRWRWGHGSYRSTCFRYQQLERLEHIHIVWVCMLYAYLLASIKLDKPASGITGLRAKYWSGHKSGLDTGENRWFKSNQWHAFAHLCVFLSLCGATGRSGDPGASYGTDCRRLATEGIYIIHRYIFSSNRLPSSSVVLLVLIRGSQPHACALFACMPSGKIGSASLLAGPGDTEPLLGYCIWQLLTPVISIGPAQNRSNCV